MSIVCTFALRTYQRDRCARAACTISSSSRDQCATHAATARALVGAEARARLDCCAARTQGPWVEVERAVAVNPPFCTAVRQKVHSGSDDCWWRARPQKRLAVL